MFNSFSIPLDLSFQPETFQKDAFLLFQLVVDIAFVLDIFICFRTTYMDEIGKEVFDSRLIAMQYLSGSFLIDLVAALPVELFTDQQQ